jgi:hypothetical protein
MLSNGMECMLVSMSDALHLEQNFSYSNSGLGARGSVVA